ncbi:hypothetical protein [Pseudoalteromonas piratica]|uniref:Uncharacterized protein n=1 Tax=Pseudoalteromonas piratica TaxID=1348114 RepID=A0A0A7EJH2_9GAMM|nr:hypothetical protein [Pseudoalteromonas piratica]AIY66845.1 hypothetical protein OM33_17220 [Pseudoalteromonas piratica]
MSEFDKEDANPFNGLSKTQSKQLHTWYLNEINNQLTTLLKGSQSGQVLEKKLTQALTKAASPLVAHTKENSTHNFNFKIKNGSVLQELKDTRDVLQSAQLRIAQLQKQQLEKGENELALEAEVSRLKAENRNYRKRLSDLLQSADSKGGTYLKVHFVGRIFVHALKSSFADWQQTDKGKAFQNKDFYSLFPRVLYRGLLKELELLIGQSDYSRINQTLSSYVYQTKGVPVENWPDEDPIYNTRLINQKQHELLFTLRTHHDKRKNFANYLEKKLEKTGFTPMHGKLLVNLIQHATDKDSTLKERTLSK